jgi:hypothetical protein
MRQAACNRLYALKIIPMLRDDWLGTWTSRLRLLPMLQHANVLRYFPSEWHQRGGQNRRTVSYSAVYLIMEYCEMCRFYQNLHSYIISLDGQHYIPLLLLQHKGPDQERPHRGVCREALLLAGASDVRNRSHLVETA